MFSVGDGVKTSWFWWFSWKMAVPRCKWQTCWERPGPPAAELYVLACVESHALLLHTQFRGYLKSHISNIQNLRGGKYLSLSLKPVAGSSHHGFSNKATRNDVVHWETSGPGETQKSQGTFITILTPVQNTLASLQSHNQSNSTHKLRIKATLYVLCLRILTWLNKQPLLLGGSIDLSSVDIWTFSVLFYCAQFNFELSFTGRVYCSWFAVSVRVTELCTICTAITNLERTFSWVMSRVVMNKNKYSSMLMRHTFRKAFANIVYGTFQEWEGLKVFIKTAFFLVQQMFSERG